MEKMLPRIPEQISSSFCCLRWRWMWWRTTGSRMRRDSGEKTQRWSSPLEKNQLPLEARGNTGCSWSPGRWGWDCSHAGNQSLTVGRSNSLLRTSEDMSQRFLSLFFFHISGLNYLGPFMQIYVRRLLPNEISLLTRLQIKLNLNDTFSSMN